ncbi:RadC family protein [Butyrivibrio proteoclasticus]|uniref:RadC family protein n=1 Tax=Butyrivibrio proteoclasticus TaxID=43305 RepID=UPI00047E3573|nr:DNA repair protein RadC [Butyrivibrio proteoclasticus]
MGSYSNMILREDSVKDELPYERFLKYGPESLTDVELLAIIIRTGSGDSSPTDIARRVLNLEKGKERGLNSLYSLSVDELKSISGIGEVKAVRLKCISEIAKRMSATKALLTLECNNSASVADYFMERLRHEEKEKFILLCLNNKLKLISEVLLSIGTINSASVSPRDIFIHALKCGASNLIIVHNHPGGDPSPSSADISITNRITRSGQMLDVILRDHIIIGDQSYCSLKDRGLLWQ